MADNNQIITGSTIETNPRIQASGVVLDTFSIAQRNQDLDRYWAVVDQAHQRRRYFPTEYWKLDNLINQTEDLAIIVNKINDPFHVSIQWIAYNPEKPLVLNTNSRCFVLPRNHYEGTIEVLSVGGVSYQLFGLKQVKSLKANSNFLAVLLGKDANGDYTVYFQNISAKLIEDGLGGINPAPGGEPVGGVRIP